MEEIKVFESKLSVAQELPFQMRMKVEDRDPKDIKLLEEYLNVKKDLLCSPEPGKSVVGLKLTISQIVEKVKKEEEIPESAKGAPVKGPEKAEKEIAEPDDKDQEPEKPTKEEKKGKK